VTKEKRVYNVVCWSSSHGSGDHRIDAEQVSNVGVVRKAGTQRRQRVRRRRQLRAWTKSGHDLERPAAAPPEQRRTETPVRAESGKALETLPGVNLVKLYFFGIGVAE
jgi:hypothetical protein